MVLGGAAFWVNQADEVAVGIVVKIGDGVKAGAVFLQAHELAQAVVLVVCLTVFMVAGLVRAGGQLKVYFSLKLEWKSA